MGGVFIALAFISLPQGGYPCGLDIRTDESASRSLRQGDTHSSTEGLPGAEPSREEWRVPAKPPWKVGGWVAR